MASILDTLVKKQGSRIRSNQWYRQQVSAIGNQATRTKLMKQGSLRARPAIGLLNLFVYDPKYKKTLPLYDTFPLVLPLDAIEGGFSGINFHYLPPLMRLRLLEKLQRFATNKKNDNTTRLDVSWERLKRIPEVKRSIKKYLFAHVRSGYLKIDYLQSAISVYLPVQQFKKGQPY